MISKDTSGFTSDTLLIRFAIMLSVYDMAFNYDHVIQTTCYEIILMPQAGLGPMAFSLLEFEIAL